MLSKLSYAEFMGLLIAHIGDKAGAPCVASPVNEPAPFYSPELVRVERADTKTAFIDRFKCDVHCVAEAAPEGSPYSPVAALEMARALEEAMTEDVGLPKPFLLLSQVCDGLQSVKEDPSREGHAVVSYTFDVCYGYRVK